MITEYLFYPIVHTPWLFLLCLLKSCFLLFVVSWFLFGFLDVNSISFCQFLPFDSKTLTLVQTVSFVVRFQVFYGLAVCLSFLTIPFKFPTNFRHSWLGRDDAFCNTPQWIAFFNKFYYQFHCFNWQFFWESHVSFQLGLPNCLLKSSRIFKYIQVCLSRLLLSSATSVSAILFLELNNQTTHR